MYIDDKGHVQWNGVSEYSDAEKVKQFVKDIGGESKLNKIQLQRYKELVGEADDSDIKWSSKFEKNKKDGRVVILDLRFDVANRPH